MEENGLTPQVDTTAFTMQGNAPVRMPDTQTPMTFASPTAEISQMSPETTNMVNNVRFDALGTVNNKNNVGSVMEKLFPDAKKLDLSTTVPLTETHEQLNDGETWLPKYTSYLPGVDNEARLARQQTNFDKFLNPVKRFVSNTAKAPLDIASFVYGVGDAAISGRFDALYDNSFSKYVDDLTTKTNFNYKNYYDKSQSDLGFNLYTWDKFGSGAEFTARMLASEALIAVATGGTSVPASMAKWGLKGALYADRAIEAGNIVRAGNKLSKMFRIAIEPELEVAAKGANVARTFERMTQGLETAANRGAWGDRLVQLRFATTSPMYEAGFEAMHFRKEAQQDFWNYYNQMGKEPTIEEINKFNDKMDGAANWVFGLNMGILSISNLALFGDMLSIKNPLAKYMTSNTVKNNVFRIGTETGENGLKQVMKAGFWNKTAAYASPFVKGALIEGVYEEGSQGIASSTFKNYAASSYNKDYMQNSSDYASAFSKAFNDQFSTKEGIEEVVIGALVGGIFGGVGGAINTRKEYARQEGIATLQNAGQEFIDNYRGNAYTNEQLLSLFSHANRFQDLQSKMENAEATGDKFKQAQLSAESFTSLLNAYHTVGKEAEFLNMWSSMMTGMDNQALAESTGLPIDQIDAFKSEQIQNMTQFASNYAKGREAAEYMFRPNIGGFTEIEDENGVKSKVNYNNLVDAFSYSYGMSFFNQKYATETFDAFQNKLAELTRNQDLVNKFGALGALKMANPLDVAKYNDLEQKLDEANQRMETLTDELNQLNRSENKANLGEQLLSKAKEIDNIQRRLEALNSEKTLVWNSMIDNFYTKMDGVGFAEQMDLKNFTEQVNNIQETLNNSIMNQADKLLLNQLLDQFDEANEAYKSYSNLVTRLGDPRFTYKTYRGLFGNKRASVDKSLNEHTRDTLAEIYNSDYNTSLSTAFATNTPTESSVTSSIVADMNNEDYQPTPEIIQSIKNKLNQRRTLTKNEKAYYDKFKTEIDSYESEDTIDPLQSSSDATRIDSAKLQVRLKEQELSDLIEGTYSPELQERINKIIEDEQTRVQQEEEFRRVTQENVDKLNQEIQALENEIASLEESNRLDQERVERTVNANKSDYQQFEYTKPNGDTIIGHLEINKGILQIVNSDEIVDIREENTPLRNLNTDNIEGLTRVQEDDILIEGNEIYVNGKIYRFKNLDDAIKEDEDGNYTVTLKSRNGRNVVFRGEIADKIVYENLLNKLIQEATDERIEQLNRQIEADKLLEEKYEELVAKTEDRDSQRNSITSEEVSQEEPVQEEQISQEAIEAQQRAIQEEIDSIQERRLEELSELREPLFPMSDANNWGQDLTPEQQARKQEYDALRKEINDRYDRELATIQSVETPQSTIESTVDAFSENPEVQRQIEDAIAQEQVRLEGELSNLRDNATLQERKEQLISDIQNLTAELLEQETPDTYKVSLLNQMELQLDALNNIPVPFNPNDTYFNQLDWIIKNIPRLNFETVEDLAGIQPPVESDVLEYADLLAKDENTTEEKRRIAELREKLLPFNLADGLSLDGLNILDLVDLYNQSKKIQDINENQQVEIPEEEMQRITKDVKDVEKTTSFKSASVGLNYDGAYIEQRSKNQTISHIHLTTMLIKSIQKGFSPQIIIYDEQGDVEATLDVTRDNLENIGNTYDNVRNIKVILSPDVYVRKPSSSTSFNVYGEILPLLDLRAYAITGQPTSFNLIYDENIDGTFSAAESEFDVSIDGNILNFDKEVLNGIEAGDTVTLEFQPNDDYNKTLTPEEYVTKANIYIRKNGKLVNILKASDIENKTNSDSWNNLDATRRRVIAEYNKGKKVELTVSDSYLGLPVINLNEDGSPIEVPLDETKVLGYGYVDVDGTMKGEITNIQIDNQQYVEPLLQYGKATPVVAFEAYGRTFAFPIILRTGVNTTYDSDIDAITNDTSLSREQKIFQLNNLLEMNGMLTQDVAQSNNNFNIETVRNALNSVYKKVDVTNPQEFENAVKTAFIDLNNPFMSSKLVLNLLSAENEVNVAKIETEVTDGNQNPNVSITTIDGKGRDASENKTCK